MNVCIGYTIAYVLFLVRVCVFFLPSFISFERYRWKSILVTQAQCAHGIRYFYIMLSNSRTAIVQRSDRNETKWNDLMPHAIVVSPLLENYWKLPNAMSFHGFVLESLGLKHSFIHSWNWVIVADWIGGYEINWISLYYLARITVRNHRFYLRFCVIGLSIMILNYIRH